MERSTVKMLNQILLPDTVEVVDCKNYQDTAARIKDMTIRGAGAIGAAGAYAMAQAIAKAPKTDFERFIKKAAEEIRQTRPTAQNLFAGINFVLSGIKNFPAEKAKPRAFELANQYADNDANACQKIGEYGDKLIKSNMKILTHCNAGWLAFVDWGSALSPIFHARRKNKNIFVYVDETRPRGQGSKLTAFELGNECIPFAIIADNAAGFYMKRKEIEMVIVGADRIAANGDVANKIGTYEKAVLAKENNIPFYVAAPTTTIDYECADGEKIPIEERSEEEVLYAHGYFENGIFGKVRLAPKGAHAKNPAFDFTPSEYIKGIITEKGIIRPTEQEIGKLK